jgi:hypothetical protein
MQAVCSHCGAKHILDDGKIGNLARVRFRCAQCRETSVVELMKDPHRTLISYSPGAIPMVEPTVISEQMGLGLPANKSLALTVLDGATRGRVFPVDRPRMIVGRAGADIALDDPEVSRWHCAVEVHGEQVTLRDLDSRNGTYVNDERVRNADLAHLSEFRIGTTRLRLTIATK